MRTVINNRIRIATVAAAAATMLVSGCSGETAAPESTPEQQRTEVTGTRLAVTYDGGVLVLDKDSLKPVAELPQDGFLRINAAGDQRHLFVSTADGFRVLDTGVEVKGHGDHFHYYASDPALLDTTYPAPEPGHVVRNADRVALFSDGAGTVQVLDPHDVTAGPAQPTWTAPAAHHGVAVPLTDGGLLVSVGTEEARTGAAVLDASMQQRAFSEDCPDLHGEAVAGNGAVLVGCTDGVLVWKDGAFTKIDSPDDYGRIGNQAGSAESDVILGDYKTDPDAERERPTRISLVDTEAQKMRLVELGASYSFRSLGRGPDGEALVLGDDGALRVIDPATAKITREIHVTDSWTEPEDWQQPRPTLHVEDDIAYVTEPSTSTIHLVHLESGEVVDSVRLPRVPNEITGVGEAHGH